MMEHQSPISGIAAYGNTYIATAGYDNQVILWCAKAQKVLGRGTHHHLANQVAFSPDGRHLISSSSDYTARLWSVPDMQLITILDQHHDDVEMAVFHPSAPLIATCCRDHHVRVYRFSGELIACFTGHRADVISVAWINDDELITSSDDGTIKRWSLSHNSLIDDIDMAGIETDTIVVTSKDTFFAGNDLGEILRIDPTGINCYSAHQAGIKRLVYERDRALLISLSYDRTVKIWKNNNGELQEIASSSLPEVIWPRACAFLDDTQIVFATFGSSYATYHIQDNRWDLDAINMTGGVNAVTVHQNQRLTIGDSGMLYIDGLPSQALGSLCNFLTPAGSRVITGGQSGIVFDALTADIIYRHHSPLNCAVTFERAGQSFIVVGTYTGEGLVFSENSAGKLDLIKTLPLHVNAIKSLAVSKTHLFAVCANTSAALFSLDDLTESWRIEHAHKRIANGCAFLAPNRFVSISRDLLLRIWHPTQRQISLIQTPHDHSIKCVATSADGRYIATGSYSGMLATYDTQLATWITVTQPTRSGISSLFFDASTHRFLASAYDGFVYTILIPAHVPDDIAHHEYC